MWASTARKTLDSLCVWFWIWGPAPLKTSYSCFTGPTFHSPQFKKLWSSEHQNHMGYRWPCKMLRAQSFHNTGYFWYRPYAPWRRKSVETQNINKDWHELFQVQQSIRKNMCHSSKRQWWMDEKWVDTARDMDKKAGKGDRQAGWQYVIQPDCQQFLSPLHWTPAPWWSLLALPISKPLPTLQDLIIEI